MKILIAEDEVSLQRSIQQFLEREGNVCKVASDFHEAQQKVAIYDYDASYRFRESEQFHVFRITFTK